MRTGAILLTVCAACVCACSSSGNTGSGADASTDAQPETDATMPGVDAGTDAADGRSPVDAGEPDATDAGPYDSGSDALACTWDGSFESPACSSCLVANCCATTEACQDDPNCLALNACVGQCLEDAGANDDGGISQCAQVCSASQAQSVRDEWKAWNDCIGTSCGATNRIGPCY